MARAQNNRRQEENANALVVQAPRLPYPAEAAKEVGLSEGQWKALVDAVFPSAKTVDGVMLALRYCKARQLDPFKKAVHVVPMYNAKLRREVETVWPGIGELRTTASRTGVWAGNDDCVFGPGLRRKFEDKRETKDSQGNKTVTREACPEMEFPEWAQVTVYKIVGGMRVPFVGPKVRFVEVFSGVKGLRVPNARWQLAPWQMIEKCAEAAALRRAFPEEMAGIMTAEEMEGKVTMDEHEGVPIEDHRPVMDGGESKPTRDEGGDTSRLPDWVVEDMELQKQNVDLTSDPETLRTYKPRILGDQARSEWPQEAKDELAAYFDERIRKLEDAAGADDGGDPVDDAVIEETDETPQEGDNAGQPQAETEEPAEDEEEDGNV